MGEIIKKQTQKSNQINVNGIKLDPMNELDSIPDTPQN